jgi:hypothetical protein
MMVIKQDLMSGIYRSLANIEVFDVLDRVV